MSTVNVRKLDDHVVQRLKQRAAENNRSLESEVRRILEHAVADDIVTKRKAFYALAASLRQNTPHRSRKSGAALIREDRNRGHRVG